MERVVIMFGRSGIKMDIPKNFKIKKPVEFSKDVDLMYDFLFDHIVNIGWAGRIGDYAYGEYPNIATDQDGYIYAYEGNYGGRLLSASTRTASIFIKDLSSVEEITLDDMKRLLEEKSLESN